MAEEHTFNKFDIVIISTLVSELDLATASLTTLKFPFLT